MFTGSPTSHVYFSHRLRLHYVSWGNDDAPVLLLVHGGRDHCRNWDWVADSLRHEYRIIAPDLRGHGDSQWMMGGTYSLTEYVYDIAQLVRQTKIAPVAIMGHSLGGGVSMLYTSLFPGNVSKLISIEGMVPFQLHLYRPSVFVQKKIKNWIDDLWRISARMPRRYTTLEEAFQKMQAVNPHLREDQARHLTIHGSNQNEDGTYSWKFDNYVRIFSPLNFDFEEVSELYSQIKCPTLLIHGRESWAMAPETDERTQDIMDLRVRYIENAGHWCHHDKLDEFLGIVREFLAE